MPVDVFQIVKEIALDELRSKGYAPNPADVVGIATRVVAVVRQEVANALAAEPVPKLAPVEPKVPPTP